MFSIKYKVTISDINYGGHMGNERPLLLFQQARIDFYKSLGCTELDLGDEIGNIQKESHITYHKEIFLGEELEVKIIGIDPSRSSFNIKYEIYNSEGVLAVEGSTLLIAYDYKKNKVSRIPKSFSEKISAL